MTCEYLVVMHLVFKVCSLLGALNSVWKKVPVGDKIVPKPSFLILMLWGRRDILFCDFYSLNIFICMWYFQPLVHVGNLSSWTVLETCIKCISFQRRNEYFGLVLFKVRLSSWNEKNGIANISKFSSKRDLEQGKMMSSHAIALLRVMTWHPLYVQLSERVLEQGWNTALRF